jgi:hypothetical protein
LNEPYEETLEKIKMREVIVKNSWNYSPTRTEDERKKWYQTTAYLYDLSKCHEINQELKETYNQVLRICKKKGGEHPRFWRRNRRSSNSISKRRIGSNVS